VDIETLQPTDRVVCWHKCGRPLFDGRRRNKAAQRRATVNSGGGAIKLLALLCVLCLCSNAAAVLHLHGEVVAVADGDTVTVLDAARVRHRVRLLAIDAPESGQAYGAVSAASLKDLAYRRHVVAHCVDTDRYGRSVCQLFVAGVDVGLEQIRRGMAWHFARYAQHQTASDRQKYHAAEAEARAAGRGLWREPRPVPPWVWRATR
jgi:endonuclease YncB( thermonuclease family)